MAGIFPEAREAVLQFEETLTGLSTCFSNVKTQLWRTNQSIYSKRCIFTGVWALNLCFTIFLTFLFCNGIAKITKQEENILFILTIIYPLNLLKKHLFSLLYKSD